MISRTVRINTACGESCTVRCCEMSLSADNALLLSAAVSSAGPRRRVAGWQGFCCFMHVLYYVKCTVICCTLLVNMICRSHWVFFDNERQVYIVTVLVLVIVQIIPNFVSQSCRKYSKEMLSRDTDVVTWCRDVTSRSFVCRHVKSSHLCQSDCLSVAVRGSGCLDCQYISVRRV